MVPKPQITADNEADNNADNNTNNIKENTTETSYRFALTEGLNNCQLIEDHRLNDIQDLEKALNILTRVKEKKKKKILLLSALKNGDQDYQKLADVLQTKGVDYLFCIGNEWKKHVDAVSNVQTFLFDTSIELFQSEEFELFDNAVIYINDASDVEMMSISRTVQSESNRASLYVDLDAVKKNLKFYQNKLKNGTKLALVLKASSYGAGDYMLANILQHHGVDYFAVTAIEEGVSLRKNGVESPILIFNPTIDGFHKIIRYGLTPSIYSLSMLHEVVKCSNQYKKLVPIHLKIETGMNRFGIQPEEINIVIDELRNCEYVTVKGIFSHLAAQTDESADEFTNLQAERFKKISKHIEKELEITTIKHLVATHGIARFPNYHFDMVRLGSGLCGIYNKDIESWFTSSLEEAMTLETIISQVRMVAKGSTVGYGRSAVATKDMKVAIISVGYADGLRRSMGHGGAKVEVNGTLTHTFGGISMGLAAVDVTGLEVKIGDRVTIFGRRGNDVPLRGVAKGAKTGPSSLTCGIHHRVRRVIISKDEI